MSESAPFARPLVGDDAEHLRDGDGQALSAEIAEENAVAFGQGDDAVHDEMVVNECCRKLTAAQASFGIDAHPIALPYERPHAFAVDAHVHPPALAQKLSGKMDGGWCPVRVVEFRVQTGHVRPRTSQRRRTSVQKIFVDRQSCSVRPVSVPVSRNDIAAQREHTFWNGQVAHSSFASTKSS